MDQWHTLEIAAVARETAHAIGVSFVVPAALRTAFSWQPGQHINVRAAIDGELLERTYSICAEPSEPHLRIAIKHIPGGTFSGWANGNLRAGMRLDASPPRGRFVLAPGDGAPRHILGFAAGVGITPVIGILRHALLTEPSSRVTLVFGNRTVDDIIFREELEELKDRFIERFTLLHVFSRGDTPDTPLLEGRIDAGRIAALGAALFRAPDIAHAYVCGPGTMIRDVRNALFALGLPRERVHHEFFAAAGGAYRAAAPASPARQSDSADTAGSRELAVTLDGTRHRIALRPGETVIAAAIRAGLRVPYACRGGMCCTCRAKVVEGTASMRVNYSLEPWELAAGFVLTCQAEPTSPRLAVDYDAM